MRLGPLAAPGSLFKQPKTEKQKTWRPVSTKPAEKMKVRNTNHRHYKREGNSDLHKKLIKTLPCITCKRPGPSDPSHLKCGPARAERGLGMKATDRRLVPQCRACHDALENTGSKREEEWFAARGVPDVVAVAEALWKASGDIVQMLRIVMRGF